MASYVELYTVTWKGQFAGFAGVQSKRFPKPCVGSSILLGATIPPTPVKYGKSGDCN
jgi:hypothetical protein